GAGSPPGRRGRAPARPRSTSPSDDDAWRPARLRAGRGGGARPGRAAERGEVEHVAGCGDVDRDIPAVEVEGLGADVRLDLDRIGLAGGGDVEDAVGV